MNKQGNTYKPDAQQTKAKHQRPMVGRQLHSLLDGSFLTKGNINTWLPFIGFLVVLGLLYIHNSYTAERRIRQLNKINAELIELHYDYIQIKSTLNQQTQPFVLETELEKFGIKRLDRPPQKIYIEQ